MTDAGLALAEGVEEARLPSRRHGGRSRLAAYFILQLAVACACFAILQASAPEPAARYAISRAVLIEGSHSVDVTLPDRLDSRFTMNDPPRYTSTFEWPPSEAGKPWSVMLPRFGNGVEVAINGVVVLDSRTNPDANRPGRNTPEIAPIPAPLLKDGSNSISVKLFVWGPLTGYLDRVYVGPDSALRPAYDQREFLFATMPVVFTAWQAILAVILAIMWLKRRHDGAYGVLALSMLLGVMQGLATTPLGDGVSARLNAALMASAPLESALLVIFIAMFFGCRLPRWYPLLFVPGIIVVSFGLLFGPGVVRWVYLLLGTPLVGLCLAASFGLLAYITAKRGDVVSLLLGCAMTIVIICWTHDMLIVLGTMSEQRIFTSRLSYSALLVAIGAGLTWRYASALNEVDSFAGRMVALVHETEEKLRTSFAREEERARSVALASERSRLMRDLHDGLGGQLVSIVALSERGGRDGERINEAARAALKDLRLVIDAMDDIGGDLMLALGTWRERAQAQLRAHGLTLEWQAGAQSGLPIHPELRPWHVIQIVRILDEAVTNAAKHAKASRIVVRLETVVIGAQLGCGRISVTDDGHGFMPAVEDTDGPRHTRGFANMKARATQCGAQLDIVSGSSGTCVRLDLPEMFPSVDERPR